MSDLPGTDPSRANPSDRFTGLPDGFGRAGVCAQAFHWLKAGDAMMEFQRILKPSGWVALIWNERDENDPFTGAYGSVIRSFPGAMELEFARQRAGQVLLDT